MGKSLLVQTVKKAPGGVAQTVIMDYANVAEEVEITTNRMDSPGKMTFSCVETGSGMIAEGSSVEFVADGVKMFRGYIFSAQRDKEGKASYVSYDQLRYLKAKASYVFENMSLSQIIQQIAADFGLVVGELADTGYLFPCLIKENESCLDIIFDALAQTIIQTGRIFIFYDNFGALTLVEAKNLLTNILIGEGSMATDYTYKRDIDSDTYNRVKLVRKNEKSGRTDAYVHEDTENIKKWGILQYYDQVDENLNEAQIDEMCKMYLQYYNRVLQTVTIEALGLKTVRAGSLIPIRIDGVEDLSTVRLLLAEKVTHNFEGEVHTMKIEIKSFAQLGGVSVV